MCVDEDVQERVLVHVQAQVHIHRLNLERLNLECLNLERLNPESTEPRMDPIANGLNLEWTKLRMD